MRRILICLAACMTGPVFLYSQTSRGTVGGLITDPAGAVVPNAKVELTNTSTGVSRPTETNHAGLYRFDAVDLGTYDLKVQAQGFKVLVTRTFDVRAGQVTAVDGRLELGETVTTVEVNASAATVLQTEASVRGGNLDPRQITELPFAVRNPTDLALQLPGVSTNRFLRGVQTYVVNGARGRSNNFLLDGTENNDISVAGQGFQLTNPDAVQEVSVQTSNFDAEFGRSGGAVINVITRSGTNDFHGTASYLLDSTYDDAITNTQSLSDDVQKRGHPLPGTEQWFAGTFGGRIKRDRTFFFGSYQERRQNSQSTGNVRTLSARGRATLNSVFPAGANPRVDLFNAVSKGAGDSNSQFFNVPLGNNRPDIEFGTLIFPYAQTRTDRQWVQRVDHKISDYDLLSVRYAADRDSRPVGGETTSFPGFFTSQQNRYHNALIAHTHVFSPALTNELRLSYNRIDLSFPLDPTNPLGLTIPQFNIAGITVTNVYSVGVSPNFPQGRVANNYVLQDTMSWVRGRHNLRYGFDLLSQRSRQFAPIIERGRLTYGASTGFSGFANFVDDFGGTGTAERTFGSAAYYPKLFRQAYFFQDRWRASESLTLTLGLRYEDFGTPINSLRTAAWAGLGIIDPITFDGPYRAPNKVKPDRNNFSPTVGLAYSPSWNGGWRGRFFGAKRTVFRAGYGIGYDSFFNNIASNAQGAAPNVVATTTSSVVTPDLPRGLSNLTGLIPTTPRPLTPLDAESLVPGDLVNPYYQRWSAGLQRELPANLLLDLSYVGSKGSKLFLNEQLNPTVPAGLQVIPVTTPPIPASRLNPRLDALQGSRNIRTNGGDSNYHALQVHVAKRFSKGLSGGASYTWSKLIDNGADVFSITGTNQTQNPAVPAFFAPGGLRFDRAVSVQDRTQRAVFGFVYELPWMRQQRGAVERVLGGWDVATIMTFESGVPLNVTNGLDADGFDGAGDRPDYNPGGRPGVRAMPGTSPTGYVNPDANNAPIDPATAQYIALPTQSGRFPARTGNLGRNTLRSPGINNFDVNFFKRVKVNEQWSVEFRAEFFNLFNHPQYGYPSVSPFSPGEGAIAASVATSPGGRFLAPQFADGGGRVIRYQLKIRF